MATKNSTAQVATEDVTVPAPKATNLDIAALKAGAMAPVPAEIMDSLQASMENHAAALKTKQSAARKTAAAAKTTKLAANKKPAVAKPKAVSKVERIPAETFVAELTRLHLTKTQAAQALGVSNSSITEYSGGGRNNLLAKSRWVEVKAALAAFEAGPR